MMLMIRDKLLILTVALFAASAVGQIENCAMEFYDTTDCTGDTVLFPWSAYRGGTCAGVTNQNVWYRMFRNADGTAEYVEYDDQSNPEDFGCSFASEEVDRKLVDNWFLGEGDLSDWAPSARAKNTCYADTMFGSPFCYDGDCAPYSSWQWVCSPVDPASIPSTTCEVEFFSDDSCASASPVLTLNSGECFGVPTQGNWYKVTTQPDGQSIWETWSDSSNPVSLGCDTGVYSYNPETNDVDPFLGTSNWDNLADNDSPIIENVCFRGDFLERQQPICVDASCEPYGSYRWSCENQPAISSCRIEFYSGAACGGGLAASWSDGECLGAPEEDQWLSVHSLKGSKYAFHQSYFVNTESNGCWKANVARDEVSEGYSFLNHFAGQNSEYVEGYEPNVCNDELYFGVSNFCVEDSCFDHTSWKWVCE